MIYNMYKKRNIPDVVVPYLTFESPNSFTLGVKDAKKHWDGTLRYSTDTQNWTKWDGTNTISSGVDNGKNVIYLAGTGNSVICKGNSSNYSWVLTGDNIACKGNIENLLDWQTVEAGGHPDMASDCYSNMFQGCTSLTTAPSLPATTLAAYCYDSMFYGCTSLTTAPSLPATTLENYCYNSMFQGCTSLTTAPSLPATTLVAHCYNSMFYGCTSLTTAPSLPATDLATFCYYSMFRGCTSLTTVPSLPATNLATYCYSRMFRGCTKIKLSSTRSGEYITEYRIPTSGTGTTTTEALTNMFTETGGTFTGTPIINTTYYLSNTNTIV